MGEHEDIDEESSPLLQSIRPKPWHSESSLLLPSNNEKNYGSGIGGIDDAENPEKLVRSRKISDLKVSGDQKWRRYIGIILGIIASVFLSLTTLFAKLLLNYHAFTKSMFRFLGILLPSIPIMIYMKMSQKINIFEAIWPLSERTKIITFGVLLIRAFFGCTASILQFYALDFIAIGDVSLVSFTTPVFVTILAYFVLKEKIGISSIIAAFVSLLGIGIISRPPILSGEETLDMDTTVGVSLAFGCMAFATVTYIALRWLRPVDYVVVTFFYGLYSVIECLICSAVTNTLELPQNIEDWSLAIAMAAFAFLGQACFTMALKFENAGPISLIRTLEVPFTFLWQILFLAELPDVWSVIGATLILMSVLVTGIRKWMLDLPEGNPMRIKFKFLL